MLHEKIYYQIHFRCRNGERFINFQKLKLKTSSTAQMYQMLEVESIEAE